MITCCERTRLPGRPRERQNDMIRAMLDIDIGEMSINKMESPFHPSMFDGRCAMCGTPCPCPRLVIASAGAMLVCHECHESI